MLCETPVENSQEAQLVKVPKRGEPAASPSPPLDARGFNWLGWRSIAAGAALLLLIAGSAFWYFERRGASVRPGQPGYVFSDTLSRPFSKQAWEQALQQLTPVQTVQAPEPTPEALSRVALSTFRDTLADGGQGPLMVVMPAGKFLMGSPQDELARAYDEGPQHQVTIRAFALSQTEVTFEEYDRFSNDTNRMPLRDDAGWGRATRPVINVNWRDATAYAEWLSQQTGESYRLPTEAEWEYAARAGTTTPFYTGKCISVQQANFDDSKGDAYPGCPVSNQALQKTQPVGVFPANQFGLHDMQGNVYEWVQDCKHEDYSRAPTDGSAWLERGGGNCARRVARGGAWDSSVLPMRSAIRDWSYDGAARDLLGFRLARDL
jgi:formylglycine-generating enzyme required for sulfatase activity